MSKSEFKLCKYILLFKVEAEGVRGHHPLWVDELVHLVFQSK